MRRVRTSFQRPWTSPMVTGRDWWVEIGCSWPYGSLAVWSVHASLRYVYRKEYSSASMSSTNDPYIEMLQAGLASQAPPVQAPNGHFRYPGKNTTHNTLQSRRTGPAAVALSPPDTLNNNANSFIRSIDTSAQGCVPTCLRVVAIFRNKGL